MCRETTKVIPIYVYVLGGVHLAKWNPVHLYSDVGAPQHTCNYRYNRESGARTFEGPKEEISSWVVFLEEVFKISLKKHPIKWEKLQKILAMKSSESQAKVFFLNSVRSRIFCIARWLWDGSWSLKNVQVHWANKLWFSNPTVWLALPLDSHTFRRWYLERDMPSTILMPN